MFVCITSIFSCNCKLHLVGLLQWNIRMFLLDLGYVFRTKQPKIVAQNAPCVPRINDVIYEPSLSGNHWIRKLCGILSYVFFDLVLESKIASKKQDIHQHAMRSDSHFLRYVFVSCIFERLTSPRYRTLTAPFAPITAISVPGHA